MSNYDLETSTRHIVLGKQMDYEIHAWACRQWGHPPTATARALTETDTLREAKEFLEAEEYSS